MDSHERKKYKFANYIYSASCAAAVLVVVVGGGGTGAITLDHLPHAFCRSASLFKSPASERI